MKQVKQWMKQTIVICLLLVIGLGCSVEPASAYSEWGPTRHIGKYYFKYNRSNSRLYISAGPNSGFRKTPVDSLFYASNGKKVMYVSGRDVMSYDISKKKVKKVKKLPKADHWVTRGANGSYLWLENGENIYTYNINKKRLKMVKKNASVGPHLRGSYYMIVLSDFKTIDAVPLIDSEGTWAIQYFKAAIYKFGKNGKMKLRKSLGKVYAYNVLTDENGKVQKLLYSTSRSHKIYQISVNGKKRKRIATLDGYVTGLEERYCYLSKKGKWYRYYYKTGERERM